MLSALRPGVGGGRDGGATRADAERSDHALPAPLRLGVVDVGVVASRALRCRSVAASAAVQISGAAACFVPNSVRSVSSEASAIASACATPGLASATQANPRSNSTARTTGSLPDAGATATTCTFSGFTSRCAMPSACSRASAAATSSTMERAMASGSAVGAAAASSPAYTATNSASVSVGTGGAGPPLTAAAAAPTLAAAGENVSGYGHTGKARSAAVLRLTPPPLLAGMGARVEATVYKSTPCTRFSTTYSSLV